MELVQRRAVEPHRWHILNRTRPPSAPVTELTPATRTLLASLTGGDIGDEPEWHAALTHGSASPMTRGEADYQRLEFLGDRVLGLIIAEWLYDIDPSPEGQLSQRLNALVSRAQCAAVARGIGLGPHIRLGKQALNDGAASRDNVLGDVMEAVIGATFLLKGVEAARAMVRRLWADAIAAGGETKHPKSALQEWAAAHRRKPPEYALVSRDGPDHAARFTVRVAIGGVGEALGEGAAKAEAEARAAAALLAACAR